MPVSESDYTACLDCQRGPRFNQYDESACSSGWQARTRLMGCYSGSRIPGTKARKGEQGYTEKQTTTVNQKETKP